MIGIKKPLKGLRRLEPDLFNKLLPVFGLHKDRGAEITSPGLEVPYAELASFVITFMGDNKISYTIVAEEILQDHYSLCTAITINLIRKRYLNIIIYVFS
jgi:hypothetical protein